MRHIARADHDNRDHRERQAEQARQPATQAPPQQAAAIAFTPRMGRCPAHPYRAVGGVIDALDPLEAEGAICSEISPIRKMMMLVRQSRTVEFVICTCVIVVYTPYPMPSRKSTAASGAKIFIGLKSVIMRRIIRMKRTPFCKSFWPLLPPVRLFATIGTKVTLYPAFRNASVLVVG